MGIKKYIKKTSCITVDELSSKTGIEKTKLQEFIDFPESMCQADGTTLYKLSLALGCSIENLLEESLFVVTTKSESTIVGLKKREIERKKSYFKDLGKINVRWRVIDDKCYLVFAYKGEIVVLPLSIYIEKGASKRLKYISELVVRSYLEERKFTDKFGLWK